jgi:hypothetical protein
MATHTPETTSDMRMSGKMAMQTITAATKASAM